MIIVVNGLRSGEGGGEGKEIAPGRFFLREMRSLQGYVRMYDSYFFFRGLKVREKQRWTEGASVKKISNTYGRQSSVFPK